MEPHFFANQTEFRKWLDQNHQNKSELLVGFYKVNSLKPSMNWSESVDQALCFGWIDGIRRGRDDESYTIRFTPRKSASIWSAVNIKKMQILEKSGLLKPAGIAAFEKRKSHKSAIYSYESEPAKLTTDFETRFQANEKAWHFFQSQPAGYQRTALHLVMGAKQEKTRESRFQNLVSDSENGLRLKQLRR